MNMRSPIVAILWETWRVTRVEAAWKLALGVVAALAVLTLSIVLAPSAEIADFRNRRGIEVLLFLPHFVGGYLLRGSVAINPVFRFISITPVRFGRQSWSASRWRISRP